jgi:hypothetical protein
MKKVIPFDLDHALKGADVRTRTLKKVKKLKYDSYERIWVLSGIIGNSVKDLEVWTLDGSYYDHHFLQSDLDLIIVVNYPLKEYIKDKFNAFLNYFKQ